MDDRLIARIKRDALIYARLYIKRDAARLPAIDGIRWIGAAELVDRYRAHDATRVEGGVVKLPEGAEAIVTEHGASRLARG